jgi:hypothetical protein
MEKGIQRSAPAAVTSTAAAPAEAAPNNGSSDASGQGAANAAEEGAANAAGQGADNEDDGVPAAAEQQPAAGVAAGSSRPIRRAAAGSK